MTVSNSDLFLINRGGTDYSVSFEKIFADIDANITIGDGTITFKEANGTTVGSFTTNQAGDAEITLPQVVIPESLHPKGFINVEDPAPADPEHGDIYIQHDAMNPVAKTPDASFVGLSGQTVEEGVFVIFGVDDLWHAGGQANQVQTQADWDETDATEAAYIKNKPDFQAEVDAKAGNGAIEVNAGAGLIATGQNAFANQNTNTTRTLAVVVGDGISIDGSGAVIIDPSFNLDGNITAPNDGVLTINDSDGNSVGTFTADQASNTTVTLPKGFSGSYDDLTEKPDIHDGKLQLTDPTGSTMVVFSANQDSDQTASVYLKDSYIQNLPVLS